MITKQPDKMGKYVAFLTDGFDDCTCEGTVKLDYIEDGHKWKAKCRICNLSTEWAESRSDAMIKWNLMIRSMVEYNQEAK